MILIATVDPIWCGRLRRLTAQVFLLAYAWAAAYRLVGGHEQVCLVAVVSSVRCRVLCFEGWLLSHDAYLLDNSLGLGNIAIDLIEVVLSSLILRLLQKLQVVMECGTASLVSVQKLIETAVVVPIICFFVLGFHRQHADLVVLIFIIP